MNEIAKKQAQPLDGFADFDPGGRKSADGDSERGESRLIGDRLKFTNEGKWEIAIKGEDASGRALVATGVRRTEVKWGDDGPVDGRELGPGEQYRDLDAVNETVPKSEWRVGPDGKPQGPWQRQHVLELVDLTTGERFSWATGTIGGVIAIVELRDRIQVMRRFRGSDVYPLVELADVFMPTRFGGRQRFHLKIKDWIHSGSACSAGTLGVETKPPLILPPSAAPAPERPLPPAAKAVAEEMKTAPAPAATTDPADGLACAEMPDGSAIITKAGKVIGTQPSVGAAQRWIAGARGQPVKELTLGEEMGDGLSF